MGGRNLERQHPYSAGRTLASTYLDLEGWRLITEPLRNHIPRQALDKSNRDIDIYSGRRTIHPIITPSGLCSQQPGRAAINALALGELWQQEVDIPKCAFGLLLSVRESKRRDAQVHLRLSWADFGGGEHIVRGSIHIEPECIQIGDWSLSLEAIE